MTCPQGSGPGGLGARRARATQPFDPYGFWRDHVSRKLEAYEYLYRTGSHALYDHYFRGLPKLADTED